MLRALVLLTSLVLAVGVSAAHAQEASPEQLAASRPIASNFFALLEAHKNEQAFSTTFATVVAKKPAEMQAFTGQVAALLGFYGDIIDWKEIGSTEISPDVIDVIYVVRTKEAPVFFKIGFYQNSQKWIALNIYFTDTYKKLEEAQF